MVGARMFAERADCSRKYNADSKYALQEIASGIQTEVDKRQLSYDEALMLGNMINRADQVPGDSIVYAIPTETPIDEPSNCTFGTLC